MKLFFIIFMFEFYVLYVCRTPIHVCVCVCVYFNIDMLMSAVNSGKCDCGVLNKQLNNIYCYFGEKKHLHVIECRALALLHNVIATIFPYFLFFELL